jgi:hypothetical protein
MLAAVVALVSPCLLASASAAVGPFAGTPKNVRSITPQVTSSSISSGAANHVVVPTGSGNGKLLVFLPGSGASPQGYDDILEAAATGGYRAIGLTYNNAAPASTKCIRKPSCFGPLHQRVFNGTGSSSVSRVSPADGVAHRLASLLGYLSARYPAEGWSAYLNNGATRWSSVVIAGHSQGAGEAAYIASIRKVAGVLLFAGVVDGNGSNPLATWLSDPHVTPSTRYAALTNTKDTWYGRQVRSWVALGIPGADHPQSIDAPAAVTGATHAFVTSAAARIGGALSGHDEVAADPYVPVCADGSPRLTAVWTAMLAVVASAQQAVLTTAC